MLTPLSFNDKLNLPPSPMSVFVVAFLTFNSGKEFYIDLIFFTLSTKMF